MKTILVIDDERNIRRAMVRVLQGKGFHVVEATNATEGIDLAQTHRPDLILSDVMMTGQDGFAMLDQIRRFSTTAAIPVILMTGDASLAGQTGMRRGMELGADDFLIKPFLPETLLGTVHARLRKQDALRQEADSTKARLHEILEASIDLVAIVSAQSQHVIYLNQTGRKLFGLVPEQEIPDLSLSRLHAQESLRKLQEECVPTALQTGVWKGEMTLLSAEGRRLPVREVVLTHRAADGSVEFLSVIAQDISESKRAADDVHILTSALEAAANGVCITDPTGTILWVNPAFTQMTGYSAQEAVGQKASLLKSGQHDDPFYSALWKCISSGQVWHGEFVNRRKDGTLFPHETTITPVRSAEGRITHYVAVSRDISHQRAAEAARQRMEVQLRHAQKLESIGQLAAGIAHEINTPTQYIGDNTRFLQDSFEELKSLLARYDQLLQAIRNQTFKPQLVDETVAAAAAADVDYLVKEVPQAIRQTLQGVERVSTIVRAMKDFSHPGEDEKIPVDLNHAIESTTTVARNEWKYVAELEFDLDPRLPLVACFPGEFNQAILNLIINAAHAIAEVVGDGSRGKGRIRVTSRQDGDAVEIRIQDTGSGIPEKIQDRILDPFFTTKPVGKGTGQGLTIAHAVVVEQHGGSIHFETETGRGTTFIVRLPINPSSAKDHRNEKNIVC